MILVDVDVLDGEELAAGSDGMICCGHSLVNSMLARNLWVVVLNNDGVLKPTASSCGFIVCSNSSKFGSNRDMDGK